MFSGSQKASSFVKHLKKRASFFEKLASFLHTVVNEKASSLWKLAHFLVKWFPVCSSGKNWTKWQLWGCCQSVCQIYVWSIWYDQFYSYCTISMKMSWWFHWQPQSFMTAIFFVTGDNLDCHNLYWSLCLQDISSYSKKESCPRMLCTSWIGTIYRAVLVVLWSCAKTTGRPAQGCDYCNYPNRR